nr:MAG TPA: hypothetical protein [Caudoviricetes sp.]
MIVIRGDFLFFFVFFICIPRLYPLLVFIQW